jgi:membrane fusion protein (multidrug efflux system)
MANEENEKPRKRKFLKTYLPLIIVIIVVLAVGAYWYTEYSKYISTDDAYIDSDIVSVGTKYLGRIAHLYYGEGDSVKKGMLLVELDTTDLHAQKKQAFTLLDQAIASQIQTVAKYKYDQQNIKVLEVNLDKTRDDYYRAKNQVEKDVISKEQYEHIEKAFESTKAQLEAAKTQLQVSRAQINNALATIENAKAQIGIIETQMNNTRLISPIDGIVAKRWLLPGDIAQPGQSILTLTNNKKLWITAYLEETKVAKVHLNQKVRFSVDAFPGTNFYGSIFYIGNNTASQFSLIPPNNASGNFTKVTQRMPIKISIDGTEKNENLSDYRLCSGMSIEVKIVKD